MQGVTRRAAPAGGDGDRRALLSDGFDPNATYTCDGASVLGNMRLRCWNTYGHGPVALRKAIEQSCNAFFCHLGNTLGYDAIYAQAHKLGLGATTGIDLPSETGLLPTADGKRKTLEGTNGARATPATFRSDRGCW